MEKIRKGSRSELAMCPILNTISGFSLEDLTVTVKCTFKKIQPNTILTIIIISLCLVRLK